MITASALKRFCRHDDVLKARKPRSAALETGGARGTVFHAAAEAWIKRTCDVPQVEDLEIQGWIDLLTATWEIPRAPHVEVAWGLTMAGQYIDVVETSPGSHVYVTMDPGVQLLTAGRSDLCWTDGGELSNADWKTGKWPAPPARENLQVNAGGIALAQRFGAGAYRPGIYYARDGYWDWGDTVELGSLAHAEMLADIREAAQLDAEPHPGAHCGSCWERRACPSSAA